MALIAHWPLNGNTNDISGNGYTVTNYGATIETGKIGQCFVTDGASTYFTTPSILPDTKNNFSLSFWVYPTGNTISRIMNPNSYGYDHAIQYDYTNQRILVTICETNNTNERNRASTSLSVPVNTWTHITVSMQDLTIKIYINGSLNATYVETIAMAPWSGLWWWGQRGVSTFWFAGKLNDIRLYDHILTDMEIQEIARAKILHYTFDDMQEPTTNQANSDAKRTLFNHSSPTGTAMTLSDAPEKGPDWKKVIITARSTSNHRLAQFQYINHPTNTIKTYSVEFDFGTTTGYYWRIDGYSGGGIESIVGNRFSSVYSTTTNSGDLAIFLNHNITGATGLNDIIYYRYYQVEVKPYPTEFTEGIRTGRVNDYSGFFNHSVALSPTVTPRWTPESKIGTGAYTFNKTLLTYIKPAENLLVTYKDFTVSAWIYLRSEPTDTNIGYVIAQHYGGGGWILSVRATDEKLQFRHHRDTANGFATAYNLLSTFSLQLNTWYHVAAKDDGTTAKIYINGVEDASFTITTIIPGPSSSFAIIGAFNTVGNFNFDGDIDDLRVYATTLSDKDIKDLYEARAEIEQSGVLYARDLVSNAEATVNLANTKIFGPNVDINGVPSGKYASNSSSYGFTISSVDSIESTGKSITASIYLRSQTDPASTYLFYVFTGTGPDGGWWNFGSGTLTRDWKRIVTTRSDINGPISSIRLYRQNSLGTMDYADLQLEMNDHVTPFASKYRPAIQLPSTLDFAGNEVHETGTANFEDFSTVGITDGLIGYWPLNYNSKDYSGNNYNGTNYGSMPILDSSTYFNGAVTNYIQLPNSTITNLGDFTFSFFAKFTSISKAINTIFHATNTGGNDLSLEFYSNMIRPILNTGSYFSYNTTNLNNIWYHFVIKRTGSTIEVIKDNISLGINTYPTTVYSIAGAIILGHEQDAVGGGFDATQSFEGYLSNFKLFNRALTAEEISIEYNTMFNDEVQVHESGTVYAKDFKQY